MRPMRCPISLLTKSTRLWAAMLLVAVVIVYFVTDHTMLLNKWRHSTLNSSWLLKSLRAEISENLEHRRRVEGEVAKMSYNCSVLELFAPIDPTAIDYDSDLVCDQLSPNYDIVCRMHLRQIGMESQQSAVCRLENERKVPKVVYYVIFGVYRFRLVHYVSLVAAKRFLSSAAIYVVGDQHPTGKWWQKTLADVHGIRFVYRQLPGNISGLPAMMPQHLSDIVRLQLMYMNGGIYLDADMIVLQDLEPLLNYDLTLGLIDNSTGMGNAFIVAARENAFIQEWYTHYATYNNSLVYWNSLQVPHHM